MIKIVAVDDDSDFKNVLSQLGETVENSIKEKVEARHINPNDFENTTTTIFVEVSNIAKQGCDLFAIDMNLKDTGTQPASNLAFALSIADAFRKENRTAIVFLYSGTLSKFIRELLAQDTTAKQKVAESNLKSIFQNQVADFVSRDDLEREVILALNDLPILLRIERALANHGQRMVRGQESLLKGKSFSELALEVRKQTELGRQISNMVSQHGIAALVDLNV
ncbi:hypothetical protein OAG63_00610 [Methylacidiphilales bacterium]|nr:hypothetical protein [Candidatus Methylacidiphilales bacterium]